MAAVAWYPGAVRKPLPENGTEPVIDPTQVILHTAACRCGDSLHDDFNRAGNDLESHFYVQSDGGVEQYMDTVRQADANYRANVRAVSIETQDDGDPTKPWAPAQLDAIVALIVWLVRTHPRIAVRLCPAWDASGIGHHTLFGAPGPWTPVAKSCPGPARKRQVPEVISRVQQSLAAPPAPERNKIVVRNHVRTLVAPNGGWWHLQRDGGIITASDNRVPDSPVAPYWGSVPGDGGLPQGSVAIDLVPFQGGYAVVVQHADGSVTGYHYPAR